MLPPLAAPKWVDNTGDDDMLLVFGIRFIDGRPNDADATAVGGGIAMEGSAPATVARWLRPTRVLLVLLLLAASDFR